MSAPYAKIPPSTRTKGKNMSLGDEWPDLLTVREVAKILKLSDGAVSMRLKNLKAQNGGSANAD